MKTNTTKTTRRNFLKTAGCLTISFPLITSTGFRPAFPRETEQTLPGGLSHNNSISAWLEVLENGKVRVFTGKLELGQGIRTAIRQVATEELNTDLSLVEVHIADTSITPDESYTAGSASIESSAMSVRYATAAAREKFLELAAKKMQVPQEQLALKNGKISGPGQATMTLAEILDGKQVQDKVTLPVKLKPKEEYQWVGKPIPREDISKMVRAEQVYVQDLRFPDMLHARVVRPPAYQASLQAFNEETLKQEVPDLTKVITNGSFIGVLARNEYTAIQAQYWLEQNTQWNTNASLPTDQPLDQYLRSLPSRTQNVENQGTQSSDYTLKASYFKPYIMHGSIGPSCAIAIYQQDKLEIWSHSQGVYPLREALAKMLSIAEDNIQIHGTPGSGCYGHNGADDVAADAALLAVSYPGQHIRVQWSRNNEHAWEPYGTAMIMDLQASLDSNKHISQWKLELWSDTHSTRPGGNPGNLLAANYIAAPFPQEDYGYSGGGYRNSQPYYAIPNLQIDAHFFDGPLRVSALRSLGAYANIFAIESFMDELAHQAKEDPLAFRLKHTQDPRATAVIQKLKDLVPYQQGIGYAFSRYKNTDAYCAVAAQVAVDEQGKVMVQQLWGVIEAGETINLDGLKNQTEGGLIQSASWTLQEEVGFDDTHINTLDWGSYPIFRFMDIPSVTVEVIDRPDQPPLGAGEAAQGPTSAALANAVFDVTGKRIRHLPIKPEKVRNF